MKRLLLFSFGGLLIGCAVWAYVWWHSPAETRQPTASSAMEEVLGTELALTNWNTHYFTTRYPSDLRIITSNEIPHGLTEGQYLLGSTFVNRTDQLAVTVGNLNGLVFDELPAIKLRRQKVDVYQPANIVFAPPRAVAFIAQDTYEIAVFWPQDTQYAAVVVSGSAARQTELQQELEAVVTNWRWR